MCFVLKLFISKEDMERILMCLISVAFASIKPKLKKMWEFNNLTDFVR